MAYLLSMYGLKYVTDADPGITRVKSGKGFIYKSSTGKIIKSKAVINRIKKIVIPPAWKEVWICNSSNGHIQATGRDQRGRKQYKYHTKWTEKSNEQKFDKLLKFGEALGKLRTQISKDLKLKGMPKAKVVATVLKLMEITKMRVGNAAYAKENKSYGLTTIRNNHAKVKGSKITFNFKGKSGVINTATLNDPRLSKIIKNCQDLPGQELFTYKDEEGNVCDITSDDVNKYIKESTKEDLTAKDFRTWTATTNAIDILLDKKEVSDLSDTAWKKCQVEIIKQTAKELSNTVAVCRKYYVHPKIFEAARDGSLFKKKRLKSTPGLKRTEKILIALVM